MDAPIQPLNQSNIQPMTPPSPAPPTLVPPKPPAPPPPAPKPPTPPVTPPPAPKPTPAPILPSPTPNPTAKPSTPLPPPVMPTTPKAPAPTPLPPKEHHWFRWILLLVLLMVLGALAYLFAWPMLQKTQTLPAPPATIDTGTPPAPTPVETPPSTPVATTTPAAVTTTPAVPPQPTALKGYGGLDVHAFGEKTQMFVGDQVAYSNDVSSNRALKVSVMSFSDSRCHAGVQCIWAGEQGVNLHVTNIETGQEQDVYLGLVRAKTASVFGHLFTLNEIDEGKGGTFASITVD